MRKILGMVVLILAPFVLLADFPICTEPWGDRVPGVAWGKTNYLVVWTDSRHTGKSFSYDIFGQLVSEDGALIDTNFPISRIMTNEHQGSPAIAFDGNNFLVVWYQQPDTIRQYDVYGQFVSDSGVLIDTNFPICNKPDTQWFCTVAYAGTTYLVVWEESYDLWGGPIYGQFVSRDGDLIDTNFCIYPSSDGNYPAVIGSDSNFLVVWGEWDIHGQLVRFDGSLIGGVLPICEATYEYGLPRGAFDGEKYLVVWGDKRDDGYAKTYGQFVSPTGALIDTNFPIITKENGYLPSVTWNGTNYLVVGGSGEVPIKGQFVNKNGALVGTTFTVSTLDSVVLQQWTKVAWGNTNYLVVWEDYRIDNFDIYGAIVSPLGVEEARFQIPDVRLQICPNLFRQVTSIKYQVSGIRGQIADVRIQLYDMTGRMVKTLVNEEREPGYYEVKWNAENLANGVYFLKLSSGKFITTKKVIIVR